LRLIQTSILTANPYSTRIAPKIHTQTYPIPNKGTTKGHLLTLSGTGFSNNLNDYECSVAGQPCSIVSTSLNEIAVNVPPY